MTHRTVSRIVLATVRTLALLLLLEQAAHAATGTIVGAAFFRNMNGNYCPSTNGCVGSRYLQADYDKWLPISNAFVNVYDTSWNYLGQGVTDSLGQFSAPWTKASKPAQVIVKVFAWQKESRVYLADAGGAAYGGYTYVTLSPGATTYIFNQYWGTSVAPDEYFNAYWAAELQWRRVMELAGILQTNFTNVELRGFADTIPGYLSPGGNAPFSAAVGSLKRVQLSLDAKRRPQARVMHELGHIADYLTKPWTVASDATWNGGAAGAWSATSGEWGHMAFNEAWATHYGNIAFWYDSAVTPTTCFTNQTCYSVGVPVANTDVEASSYPFNVNNCSTAAAAPEARWPLSMMRYFWDVFDNRYDGDGDTFSASQSNFWRHLSNTSYYPDGLGLNQLNEPWSVGAGGAWVLTEKDGRGATSSRANYLSISDTTYLWLNNCSPP